MLHIITAIVLLSGQPEPAKAQDAPEGRDIVWRSAGPGGGGWIQSIAWDPHDPQLLYVGCDVGGFYFSTDAGQQPDVDMRREEVIGCLRCLSFGR